MAFYVKRGLEYSADPPAAADAAFASMFDGAGVPPFNAAAPLDASAFDGFGVGDAAGFDLGAGAFMHPPPFDAEVEEEVEVDDPVFGVATAVVGSYVTPLASAATWKTEPLPYS